MLNTLIRKWHGAGLWFVAVTPYLSKSGTEPALQNGGVAM